MIPQSRKDFQKYRNSESTTDLMVQPPFRCRRGMKVLSSSSSSLAKGEKGNQGQKLRKQITKGKDADLSTGDLIEKRPRPESKVEGLLPEVVNWLGPRRRTQCGAIRWEPIRSGMLTTTKKLPSD
ncbi:unnamed protein product [Toxocara canis]|uniref:Uncharacterized protein n=1 Tax=Toxocara canis TaxID=6265 RepID=A0A183VD23_TOXCA|nr:unnamed protein product [Toxocara canis]